MRFLKRLLKFALLRILGRVARSHPQFVLQSLGKDPERLFSSLNPRDKFSWDATTLGKSIQSFEDLLSLFYLSPLNRGLIRQDLDEAMMLHRVVSALPNPHGVEIGRFKGGSTFMLAAAVGAGGHLTSIDVAPADDSALRRALERAGLTDRVRLIVGDANQVTVNELFDFVFIDGDHTYASAKRDHERWTPLLKPGGLAIYHDMASARPRATQWDDLKRLRQEIVEKGDLVLVEEVASMSVFRSRRA